MTGFVSFKQYLYRFFRFLKNAYFGSFHFHFHFHHSTQNYTTINFFLHALAYVRKKQYLCGEIFTK